MSPSVNWDKIAELTDGFSGADLQAVLYNAHLDAIHSSLESSTAHSTDSSRGTDEKPVAYRVIGGSDDKSATMSRAEKSAFERRVSGTCACPKLVLNLLLAAANTSRENFQGSSRHSEGNRVPATCAEA